MSPFKGGVVKVGAVAAVEAAKPSGRIEMITPAIAAQMLAQAGPNRPLSLHRVEVLAADMRAGTWQLNGATICIADDGRLLDGQHRLAALIAARIALPMFVARGLDSAAFSTIDAGKKRSVGDVLAIDGVPFATTTASAARRALAFLTGVDYPPRREIIAYARAHPYLAEAAGLARAAKRLPPGPFAAVMFLANEHRRYDVEADQFAHRVGSGWNLSRDDPAFVLREWAVAQRWRGRGELNGEASFAAVARCWTAWARGKRLMVMGRLKDPALGVTEIEGMALPTPPGDEP